MQKKPLALALAAAFPCLVSSALAQSADAALGPVKDLGIVIIRGGQPSSLPTQIPTTLESITREQIERSINATDSEDALKYFPSLLVRKRYIGDYDHAVLATRASGTGNSARSLVFADGILLSNLLGNGASFTPRWGLVTPEEIDRVDVLYGPFSAAYSGNSVGAVVDFVTRLPTQFEAHAALGASSQKFQLYGTADRFSAGQASASLGNKAGDFYWWFNVNHLQSNSQPLFFGNRLVSTGTPGAGGTPVTGAVPYLDPRNRPALLNGDNTRIDTEQDHAKVKLAYDLSSVLRASYVLGYWKNEAQRTSETYLRDAAGNPVFSGNVNINGSQYSIAATDLSLAREKLEHVVHALTLKRNTKGFFDYEVSASVYDYVQDSVRSPTVALPGAFAGGAGRITRQDGTGWNTLSFKGTLRPGLPEDGSNAKAVGQHIVDFGYQREAFKLRSQVFDTPDWISGTPSALFSEFAGNTELHGVYAQDTWRFAQDWKTTFGGRLELWRAGNGSRASASSTVRYGEREERNFSPKAALGYQLTPVWTLKAAIGRAVRYPTVSELYQGTVGAGNTIVNNDPNLRAEKSVTSEFSAERELSGAGGDGSLRFTLFHEETKDALYSQSNLTSFPVVTNIQNVGRINTTGVELAYQAVNVGWRGFDVSSSLTLTDSVIKSNPNFPASVGQKQPRVPDVRANVLLTWRDGEKWSYTLGARYSGEQFGQLDNSDPNGQSLTGFSKFFVADLRIRYRYDKHWSASLGIDNLNNTTYFAFHPYPQRTYTAELKFDL